MNVILPFRQRCCSERFSSLLSKAARRWNHWAFSGLLQLTTLTCTWDSLILTSVHCQRPRTRWNLFEIERDEYLIVFEDASRAHGARTLMIWSMLNVRIKKSNKLRVNADFFYHIRAEMGNINGRYTWLYETHRIQWFNSWDRTMSTEPLNAICFISSWFEIDEKCVLSSITLISKHEHLQFYTVVNSAWMWFRCLSRSTW